MKDYLIRALVDGLIAQAEARPKKSHSAACLRDAAASLLDAARSIEIEDGANDEGKSSEARAA
jgi:hypothetical protein